MDIWMILEYTISVTIIGLLIWLVKLIFHDKLDARWHYLIWSVLLVRIAVPVDVLPIPTPLSVFQAIPIGRWMEIGRILAEKKGYAGVLQLLGRIYLLGGALLSVSYLTMWIVLRVQIARSPVADEAAREYVDGIAARYGLKSCRDIRVRKSGTPYICGILRPVMVLPASGRLPAEPVIVHELLHKRYKDVLVNVGIHAVRVLNWFNPVVWWLTSVVQNDGEALCDQRVLERCSQGDGQSYGELLIAIGERRGRNPVKIGTSNMASSYRNMKTRIRRIRDFRKVPKSIGLVTGCITLMLAVSGIGSAAQEQYSFEIPQIHSEKDLEKALLYARCYHAHTPEEAIYLFLRSTEENSAIYRMAVMPDEEIPRFEEFAREWFNGQDYARVWEDLAAGKEEPYPAYFPRTLDSIAHYRIYNLLYDENQGSAAVCVIPSAGQGETFAEWKLRLSKQDGWKVWLEEESKTKQGEYEPEPLFSGSARLGDFLIELSAYNEGTFNQLGTAGTTGLFWNSAPEEAESYPQYFSMEYKHKRVEVTYLGEEPLDGRTVKIFVTEAGNRTADWDQEEPWKAAGAPSMESPAENYSYSDSEGNGSVAFDGAELMGGAPKLVYGAGSGFSQPGYCWKEEDKVGVYVRIYIDDMPAEEGEVWSANH